MITGKQEFDEGNETSQDIVDDNDKQEYELEDKNTKKLFASVSTENIGTDRRSKSSSPKVLQEAHEVPQYKRYVKRSNDEL